MGSYATFASLRKPNIRYRIYTSFIDVPPDSTRNPSRCLSEKATSFDTYGDGDVQHTHEWFINGIEDCTDALQSLALAILDGKVEASLVAEMWPNPCHLCKDEVYQFAAGLRYDIDKPTAYFNLHDMKVSRSESKRHDKRWEKVESWHDGSFGRVMTMCHPHPSGMLEVLQYGLAVIEAVDGFSACDLYKWLDIDHKRYHDLRTAYECVNRFVDAYRQHKWASEAAERIRERATKELVA